MWITHEASQEPRAVRSNADGTYARGGNKRLGEDDTGTVLARCHIWASPVLKRISPAAQGRVRQPQSSDTEAYSSIPIIRYGNPLFYDAVLDRAHSCLRS